MDKQQVQSFFVDKNGPCPITDRLIAAGYRQKSGGYIKYARQCGIARPTQYWHLISSWCARTGDNARFTRRIQCGELIFWMAEVSKAVDYRELNQLADLITSEFLSNRRDGNRKIQEICFEKIVEVVENQQNITTE